jgi:hypothetical protein
MPYQAISTEYFGPTNTRGSRIVARADAGSISVPYEHGLGLFENHQAAARAFAKKFNWKGRLVGGGTKKGYCFVFVELGKQSTEIMDVNPLHRRARRGPWPRGKTPPHLRKYLFK